MVGVILHQVHTNSWLFQFSFYRLNFPEDSIRKRKSKEAGNIHKTNNNNKNGKNDEKKTKKKQRERDERESEVKNVNLVTIASLLCFDRCTTLPGLTVLHKKFLINTLNTEFKMTTMIILLQ